MTKGRLRRFALGAGITLDTYSRVVPGMQEEAAQEVAALIFPR